MSKKPILCLDFDGVIHSYTSGWQRADIILDPPVKGTAEFIFNAVNDFTISIYSSRSWQPGGIFAMKSYVLNLLKEWDDSLKADEIFAKIEWPNEKPPAMITIDDRAITFTGEWPSIEMLKAFKPWNKK